MEISVSYKGGRKVEAAFDGFTVLTDQPVEDGGEESAPSPFDYFLTSLATCTGYYVYEFCLRRDIPTEGINVLLRTRKNEATKMWSPIDIEIQLPQSFPEKYVNAVVKTAGLCSVKKHIENAPEMKMYTTRVPSL